MTTLGPTDAVPEMGFGADVARSGDTAVVGAPYDAGAGVDSGAAYVFRMVGSSWEQIAKLTALDAAPGDFFGLDVAVNGSTALIGAYRDADAGAESGSAYVFSVIEGAWTQVAKLTAADAAQNSYFGADVGISDDTAVIGAPSDDSNGANSGSAYVFRRIGGLWQQIAKLTAVDGAAGDQFGVSVAVDGDSIIVGALNDDDKGSNSGSAYVFGVDDGAWVQVAKLVPSDGFAGDLFGISVAIKADTALVGAHYDDDGASASGSAYVFQRLGSGPGAWQQIAKLNALDPDSNAHFGCSVSYDGIVALVGAYRHTVNGNRTGAAYSFRQHSGTWSQTGRYISPIGAQFEHFGNSVAVGGDTAIVGADQSSAPLYTGAAFVFDLNDGSDCDSNGMPDSCEIAAGTSADCNTNSMPDECEMAVDPNTDCNSDGKLDACYAAGDIDANGFVDLADHSALINCLSQPNKWIAPVCCLSDLDGDGDADLADFCELQRLFQPDP